MLDRNAIYERRNNALTLAAMRPGIALPVIEALNDIPLIFHELDESKKQVDQLADACDEAIAFVCGFMGIELSREFGNQKGAENAKACLKKISDALEISGRKGIRPEFFTQKPGG